MRTAFAPVTRTLAALSLAAALFAPARALAQQPSACTRVTAVDSASPRGMPSTSATSAGAPDTGHVALRILASATADEVRFVGSPRICVRLSGDAQLDSVHVLARRNITSPVVSGTTYRNVYVAVEILGRLNAECIAGRITGAAPDSSRATRCASLDARGGAGASPP